MRKRVLVIGVFDLIHRGHIELLRRAKELGDKLIVGVNSDAKVESYKRLPYIPEEERLAIVRSIRYVDEAFIMDETIQIDNIRKYKIDTIVHGDDWNKEDYMKHIGIDQSFCDENPLEIVFLPHTEGISTSDILSRISEDIKQNVI